jgi:cyclic beta-1,2-glucan synthetase
MKLISKGMRDNWVYLRERLSKSGLVKRQVISDASPLRAELFSINQMEQHGKSLAASHRLSPKREPDQLLARLAENEEILLKACKLLTAAVKNGRRISPAGEWLLDNFYLIEEHIHTARRHFPKGYSRELPCLSHGSSAGLPRVYDIALETVSHGDGRVDLECLRRFVFAYQQGASLKLGELWAIPIMLRLALIENLRRVGAETVASTIDRGLADTWADQMMEIANQDPKNLILVVADMARSNPPMVSPFVAELARRLQGRSAVLALPLTWIEQRLSESGLTIEQLVQSDTQKQASNQVSIANSIGSLRFLGEMDWRNFVETISEVEQKLREDPAKIYSKMDFTTRDRYRHAVEKIAKASGLTEVDVARKAIQMAHNCAGSTKPSVHCHSSTNTHRISHVGYYLIDQGLLQLIRESGVRLSIADALHRAGRRYPLPLFLGSVSFLTLFFTWFLLENTFSVVLQGWLFALLVILIVLCSSHLAITLLNWAATLLVKPQPLPRLDFVNGIPLESSTLVVIPTMLTGTQSIENLIEALEVRFLANRDEHLLFGLLTDFCDANVESLPEDGPLLQLTRNRIEELNEKYKPLNRHCKGDSFFLFHRQRQWNPEEQLWMGYERKRGKLAELNSLLRGTGQERFSLLIGTTDRLSSVKYVITLDTDTQLPRDAARQFVGVMAHPLNRACFDEDRQIVTEGYGIVQPRVAASLPSSNRSRYARLFARDSGIDPYTRTVSDVYQDVFGEGSFIGKGIYEVDAFETSLKGRFPENRILSHDLLEGCYARSGLLSDVVLYEDYPSSYSADVCRRYRWIRGDWQIASWLLSRVPRNRTASSTVSQKNPLSALSQWKIFDNLRRSLVPFALTFLLLLGWTILVPAWFWTLIVICVIVIVPLISSILNLVKKPEDMLPAQHVSAALRLAGNNFAQAGFSLACLPHEAYFSLDAILRTNWRLLVTKKRLLEWTPSVHPDFDSSSGILACYKSMWIAPVISIVSAVYLAAFTPQILMVAGPILFLWMASPTIAWWISLPISRRKPRLTADQITFLLKTSRKTWAFFEKFVGADDHWLPPDNYQEHPIAVLAHRTSPTNMGLSLLANLSACDFGYISIGQLIERTANSFATMATLKRYHGHFYNWYDTQSLQPLTPLYISSVDSGNLAGHLLTLRPGLLTLPDQKILGERVFDGLCDTLRVLLDVAERAPSHTLDLLYQLHKVLETAYDSRPATLAAAQNWLTRLLAFAEQVEASQFNLDGTHETESHEDPKWWSRALLRQCRDTLNELNLFAPWLALTTATERLGQVLDFTENPTLRELSTIEAKWLAALDVTQASEKEQGLNARKDELQPHIAAAGRHAQARIIEIERLAAQASDLASMEHHFLYDKTRHLLTIGYDVSERRQESSCYDLLASEARFSSFVAIAQNQVPQESWFALGRLLTMAGGEPTLMSWSGSMFEYLMPLLVMPTYENTLLDQTYQAAIERQIAYGKQRGVPWGISECGYNTVDIALNYQYRAFGVPGLGLKRGLADDLVISPYASALALMVSPEPACLNLQRLAAEGLAGPFGFYEAIDYTASRLPRGQTSAIIRSFMAHHQGMIFLSLNYLILDRLMQRRFASDPMFRANILLLQERIPRVGVFQLHAAELSSTHAALNETQMPVRVINTPNTLIPEVHLLSNGRYHVMVTNAGGGYSRWKDIAVTRWREDTTCDNWGTFCYIRDVASGRFWSNTHQPTLKDAESYAAIFSEGRAEFRRSDIDYDTHTEIVVSPEDDIELRRVRITNRSLVRRTIEITSYAEVVLAVSAAEALHPSFSNLFVQTEIIREQRTILCTRRPRSIDEQTSWMFHLLAVRGAEVDEISYETDRMRFIGRGHSVAAPQAMVDFTALSGASGAVLDPIVAIRYRINLEPEQEATIDMVTGICSNRDEALSLAGKYQDRQLADRVFELAWTHSQVVLRQINATEADAQLYGRLASSVIYANSSLRADKSVLNRNRRGQSGLWGYAISGDLPIVLLQIGDLEKIDLLRQLIQAHAYWRLKGLIVDLVIWNEDRAGYRQTLQERIMGLIAAGIEAHVINRPGGIFVRPADQISDEDRILVQSASRVIISDRRGSLGDQINLHSLMGERVKHLNMPRFLPVRAHVTDLPAITVSPHDDLLFNNGLGGFTSDGREYIITTTLGHVTPAPWVNVLANSEFGSIISENGVSYTWSENAHEFRLTPWSDDSVSDVSGEAFYLRDEESGHFWSPTPFPCRGSTPYVCRHGFGYTCFEHSEGGISSELTVYVALDAAIKFLVLKVRNESGRTRQLSATGYVEWVLGDLRPKSAMHVITEIDQETDAFIARNPYNTAFSNQIAFFDVDASSRTFSGDRTEFIGRNGTLERPAAMTRSRLSNKTGAALDPCAAIQVVFGLADTEEREFIFMLGAGQNLDDVHKLIHEFRGPAAARDALEKVRQYWQHTLGAVQVETPDKSLDVLTNGWLLYQTLACRLWGRSGYYQSGGAFGFRDQLQDVMALVHTEPILVREHLLRCAAHQFREGDVQHWWHPTSGRGVRTHCSDDFLWLPLAMCRYVFSTGDTGVLNENVLFIEGREVKAEEDSYYDLPGRSEESATLYQHCVRAILRGLRFGENGLPLIYSGDWNDGMNTVGDKGKGESVWLAFFLYDVLMQFSGLARTHGDIPFSTRCQSEAEKLRQNIERNGWDGEWYLRAYFDDGTPLGSSKNAECQIDSLPQSWSVLSGAGDPTRSRTAMAAVDKRLVRRDHALIQVLDPPFDKSGLNPGYIKGYVPGVRENGGQYTHAAIWTVMAFAELNDKRRSWELFNMINPINHANSESSIATYKVEPYVVAADVYAVAPHTGHGGWTWYTGSAGWMYRLILESLLGLRREGNMLRFKPCLPAEWKMFKLHYRYQETVYHITVLVTQTEATRVGGTIRITVDGIEQQDEAISLIDDRMEHVVEVGIPITQ